MSEDNLERFSEGSSCNEDDTASTVVPSSNEDDLASPVVPSSNEDDLVSPVVPSSNEDDIASTKVPSSYEDDTADIMCFASEEDDDKKLFNFAKHFYTFNPFEMDEHPKWKKVNTSVFAPHVRKHVDVLLSQPKLGLCHKDVEVRNPRNSFASYDDGLSNCDRFKLVIPYAAMKVEAMVVFQSSDPLCPPDFIFSDSRFFVPIDQIKALYSWDVRQSDGLLKVVKDIIQFYKKKQIQELERYEHLSFEYLCLFQLQHFNEDDIEILVPQDPDIPVLFLIKLFAEFRQLLPDVYKEESDHIDYPLLLVTFPNRESSRSCVRLYLTKKTQQLLSIDGFFQLSNEVSDHYLTRYIIAVEDELKAKAELAASRYERRKMYFTKFLSHFHRNVLEYDVMYMNSLSLLLTKGDYHFILDISLPDEFPLVTPALVFRSIYRKTDSGQPHMEAVDNYPYSPLWSMAKVLEETVIALEKNLLLFQHDDENFCSGSA